VMGFRKAKIAGVIIHMPIDLAIEIFRESGNLTVSEHPAIEKLAECIAETLDIENHESGIEVEPIFVLKHAEKTPITSKP